ncbi:mediator of RNA polymerase II transcription subunit 22 isoform X1 [Hippoglossus hippoglossus]|uniref:mediator of RNA polymerase II transcription subunit 22 isoform X1 n=1 Tax=Hippoglossus hippoglossus TaxID=8267 RepID=UPI00148B579A|nr:mediator of RNA polymerase II transcription subunit 22 isoform X1 [Hippoglossus hippoglossus]XP_034452009.1 mediator of RNA polymerase II transcription subunit 22 isoform X1 [Hippoglossus hippoglossus]XP_034452010.1 mediator of RNA polymerase II transcription subunit 22 isoform X1 [Hippoglossus hippoglossus]
MATQRVLSQSKETLLQNYNKRLKDDISSILDNFTEIIKTAKIEDETQVARATQAEQDHYEMHVRAANIVRAGESLMKLVSDLKQFLILNDFPSVNDAISLQNQHLRSLQEECDKKLTSLRDEIAIDLYELEEEYYSSSYSQWESTDLPLCEAYRQRDSWASPGSSCSSTQGDREDVDGPPSQETNPPHHLNGHGTASMEKQ